MSEPRQTERTDRAAAPVTVAVVSWNTRDLLARCLRSLAADAEAGRTSVWVVDNASRDGSAEMVRTEFPWVSLIASEENLGFGRAVNAVAARTVGEWIAPANADIAVTPRSIETLLAVGRADRRAGIVAPRLVEPDGSTQHSVHCFPTLKLALASSLGAGALSSQLGDRLCLLGYWDPRRPRRVDWAHGAFLLVRREAFDAAGGFDPRQWMYAEDLDLAWQLARRGWATRFEPAAAVDHEVAAAASKAFRERRRMRYTAAMYDWMARQLGLPHTRAYSLVCMTGAAVRFGVLTALLPLLPPKWQRARTRARNSIPFHRLGLRPRAEMLGSR